MEFFKRKRSKTGALAVSFTLVGLINVYLSFSILGYQSRGKLRFPNQIPDIGSSLEDLRRHKSCQPLHRGDVPKAARIDELLERNMSILTAFTQLLNEYIEWHSSVGKQGATSCAKILIWTTSGKQGLGDQVRGAIHALLLSMETQRYLLLDPPKDSSFFQALAPARINWTIPSNVRYVEKRHLIKAPQRWGPTFEPSLVSSRQFEQAYGHGHVVRIGSHIHPRYEHLVNSSFTYHNCTSKNQDKARCTYGGRINVAINRLAFRSLVRYDSTVIERAKRLSARLGLSNVNYGSIHARVGGKIDQRLSWRFQHYSRSPGYYAKNLVSCLLRASPDIQIVYVASDDEKFKGRVISELRNRSINGVSSPIVPRHTSGHREDIIGAARDTLVDTLLMGSARFLVTTGSGLSFLAAYSGMGELVEISRYGNCPVKYIIPQDVKH